MKNIKKITCLLLVLITVFVGTFSINIDVLANTISETVNGDSFAYITDKDNIAEKITVRYKDQDASVNVNTFKVNDNKKMTLN